MGKRFVDGLPISGRYSIRRADNGLVLCESRNLITTAGKGLVADMLIDASGFDTGLTYIAVGTGTTEPTASDTALVTEFARVVAGGTRAANVATWQGLFASEDVSIQIEELGIFGHSTATSAPGSGILFSRSLLQYDNTINQFDLLIEYELTIGVENGAI